MQPETMATCQMCGTTIKTDYVCTLTWQGRSMGLCLGCAGEAVGFLRNERKAEAQRRAAALGVGDHE